MSSKELLGYPTRETPDFAELESRRWVFRHPVVIRITHWINALCIFIILMSGLQIFNAHPHLYWGKDSQFDAPLLSMKATDDDPQRGITTIFGHSFNTTGFLGLSKYQGEDVERGFPSWATIPAARDLATARRWHFLFAWIFVVNGLLYLGYSLATGQSRFRLIPSTDQLRHFGSSLWQHLTLRFPQGTEAKRYNVLQKLTYLILIGVLLPVQILAGLTMSPGMDAFAPVLLEIFGGRQSARTVHFIIANLVLAFIIVHVAMVILAGFWNNIRSMMTGWFVIERTQEEQPTSLPEAKP